jgi:hypothetical protein
VARGDRGAQRAARNGNYKHGRYTAEAMATRRWVREKIREVRALMISRGRVASAHIARSRVLRDWSRLRRSSVVSRGF